MLHVTIRRSEYFTHFERFQFPRACVCPAASFVADLDCAGSDYAYAGSNVLAELKHRYDS